MAIILIDYKQKISLVLVFLISVLINFLDHIVIACLGRTLRPNLVKKFLRSDEHRVSEAVPSTVAQIQPWAAKQQIKINYYYRKWCLR